MEESSEGNEVVAREDCAEVDRHWRGHRHRSVVRDGALPIARPQTDVFALVKRDLDSRNQIGFDTYGGPMHANDGRDWLVQAYEEALDLAVYLRAEIERRREP